MKSLALTAENLSEVQAELERQLSRLKIAEKDILRTQLLVEEISLRMLSQGHAAQVSVNVDKKFFGKVQIRLTAEGTPYNPLIEVADWSEDDDNYYTMMILKAHRQRLHWLNKNNRNIVTINVRGETNRQLWLLLAAIVGGLLCGFVMKTALSPETIALINDNIITPINTMFLHALSMVIAPVIFFSILSGITGMGKGAGVGKLGTKLIGLYLFTSAVASIIGLSIAWLLFSGEVPQIGTISVANAEVDTYDFSLIKFIVDIVPADLVSPIVDGNMIQIIFIAVLFGSCLNAAGDKVQLLQEIIGNLNEFFMRVINVIVIFVPLIAFFAMINLVVDMGVDILMMISRVIAGGLLSFGVLLGVYMLMILFIGKLSPLPFLKEIPSIWLTPFATSSSAVSMPTTMDICIKKLGISPKITSFSIPIGTTINMDGTCVCIPVAAIMFIKAYGIAIDLNTMLLILTMTVSISIGAPAVPNVFVICILSVTTTFGVPNDIVGILFCLSAIYDRIGTCINVTGDVAATLTLARTENLVDEKIYFN